MLKKLCRAVLHYSKYIQRYDLISKYSRLIDFVLKVYKLMVFLVFFFLQNKTKKLSSLWNRGLTGMWDCKFGHRFCVEYFHMLFEYLWCNGVEEESNSFQWETYESLIET